MANEKPSKRGLDEKWVYPQEKKAKLQDPGLLFE